jgi:pantoate--beta-alanine ligase
MFEIEQKFAHADPDALAARLRAMGAAGPETHVEVDDYFNAPDRDFVRTGEAFRLRRVGQKNCFTYKGPKRAGPVKVRAELEPPLPDGEESARRHVELLVHLGFRPVATVQKTRRTYQVAHDGQDFTVCLDDVDGVGRFAEVEVVADESRADEMARRVARLANHLGLTTPEPRSYLVMLLANRPPVERALAVVKTPQELRRAVREARREGRSVGLVPTMGALHAGHRSLIDASRSRDGFVVVSVFVNPTQFGPKEDLSRYPRPFEADVEVCRSAGVDLIFHPEPATMYPPDFRTYVEVTGLQDVLEGASRPGHFRGVATVVLKLFNLVQPDRAYFGQKDAQQVRVLQQMVRDLAVPVDLVVCPTAREPDGLARSSRNVYLDAGQRANAVALSRALRRAEDSFRGGERNADVIRAVMAEEIASADGAALDYATVVDADTLLPVETIRGPVLAALAVRFGSTRLIDNVILS